jgi:hypothetical protein
MPGIASAATSVVIGQVAAATKMIRVGAGGIMLPNHAPLVIAEQFGTLNALFPGRIDLGLGRAPGTDQVTAHALRRTLAGDVDRFPQDVVELMAYFAPARPDQRIRAVPGEGQDGADLDSRLQPVRGPARRGAGTALRLRLTLRAPADGRGDRPLSSPVPAVGPAGRAQGHARPERRRRRDRRRGQAALHLAATGLPEPAHRPRRASCRRQSTISPPASPRPGWTRPCRARSPPPWSDRRRP